MAVILSRPQCVDKLENWLYNQVDYDIFWPFSDIRSWPQSVYFLALGFISLSDLTKKRDISCNCEYFSVIIISTSTKLHFIVGVGIPVMQYGGLLRDLIFHSVDNFMMTTYAMYPHLFGISWPDRRTVSEFCNSAGKRLPYHCFLIWFSFSGFSGIRPLVILPEIVIYFHALNVL